MHTEASGGIGHSAARPPLTGSLEASARALLPPGGAATDTAAAGWMRSVVDFYLAGLADDFVSAAFSSFPGAALSRSLLCCRARVHFGADRRDAALTRDLPIRDARILKALLQPPPSRD